MDRILPLSQLSKEEMRHTNPVYENLEREYRFYYQNDTNSVLHVSKPDGEISHSHDNEKTPGLTGYSSYRQIAGILGIIRLRLSEYLIVITKSHLMGYLHNHEIYGADDFDLLPLREWRVKDETERQYIDILTRHLKSSQIFYSHTYDLTNSIQRQEGLGEALNWQNTDSRFFWNHYLCQKFMEATVRYPQVGNFILPVIYGVISMHQTTINNYEVTFGLISRRSRFRAGTRYFRRGIDEDGNVANFNETEQILIIPSLNKVYSYVQTRGSVPLFWGEVNNLRYKPLLRIGTHSPMLSAQRHFQQQYDLYGVNYLVNLVNQKGYEKPVKEAYEQLVRNLNSIGEKHNFADKLHYIYFDFHHECSKMRWNRVDLLIQQLITLGLDKQGWFEGSLDGTSSKRFQDGVVRTNCMDCLDRTNVVQSQLGRWVLQSQLEASGVVQQRFDIVDPAFEYVFRNTWADNADGVSMAYSGTGALKTDFTRLGKRTKLGALQDLRNSIQRYFGNNFGDGPRQDGFDLILGNHLPFETVESPFLREHPLYIQSLPYIILGAFIMILASIFFPKEDTPLIINRLFLLLWILLLVYSIQSVLRNGLQYVNWPKLCKLDFVQIHPVVKNGESKGWVVDELTSIDHSRGLEEGKQE